MASEGMVQELDRLRKLLDGTPADQLLRDGSGGASGSDAAYAGALSAAEVGVALKGQRHCPVTLVYWCLLLHRILLSA